MSRTTTNYSLWFNEAVASVAREAWGRMMREPSRLYLYYRPNGLRFYVLHEDEPAAEGLELVTSSALPSDRTVAQLTAYLHPLCARVPVLPVD
jgi:hypothetical protein